MIEDRKCSKCGEVKPLNSENFQKIKFFKSGFSYYCNVCDKSKPLNKEKVDKWASLKSRSNSPNKN